jgi:hypothetical protein
VSDRADPRTTLHEIRNQLAVAVANIEAFRDGMLPPTPERLELVLRALEEVDGLLNDAVPRRGEPEAGAR